MHQETEAYKPCLTSKWFQRSHDIFNDMLMWESKRVRQYNTITITNDLHFSVVRCCLFKLTVTRHPSISSISTTVNLMFSTWSPSVEVWLAKMKSGAADTRWNSGEEGGEHGSKDDCICVSLEVFLICNMNIYEHILIRLLMWLSKAKLTSGQVTPKSLNEKTNSLHEEIKQIIMAIYT